MYTHLYPYASVYVYVSVYVCVYIYIYVDIYTYIPITGAKCNDFARPDLMYNMEGEQISYL